MFQTLKNAWKIEELRKRILFTLMILVIFRLGSAIVVPFVDTAKLASSAMTNTETIFGFFDLMTGGGFSNATLFALSVTPYINASIIIQLLQVVIPALERWAKEGEEGRRKLTRLTRIVAFVLSLVLACIYCLNILRGFGNAAQNVLLYQEGFAEVFSCIVIIATLTTGAVLLIWLGEQIDQKGIGNGVSLLIFTGIISNLVNVIPQVIVYFQVAAGVYDGVSRPWYYVLIPLIILVFGAMFVGIIVMHSAERRIPVQYAKRVVGRKMYGGQSSNIPIKVNMSGVLPVIFTSAILSLPATLKSFLGLTEGFWYTFFSWFETTSWLYVLLYAALIIGFNYFYVMVQYDPVKMANDIRKNSGAIPGIRPGKPTSDFISKVIFKIAFAGGMFLVLVAILPILITKVTGINIALGGTSVLIIVGVALEISNTLESYMLMRHHKGFLE